MPYAGVRYSSADIPLTLPITNLIKTFDFSQVRAVEALDMVNDIDTRAVLVEWFGEDPGDAPSGILPNDIQAEEAPYISQLVSATLSVRALRSKAQMRP
jgi:hypothetical protein